MTFSYALRQTTKEEKVLTGIFYHYFLDLLAALGFLVWPSLSLISVWVEWGYGAGMPIYTPYRKNYKTFTEWFKSSRIMIG